MRAGTGESSVSPSDALPEWDAVLTGLEADLASALAASDAGGDAPEAERWQPPVGLGPLPTELEQRARALASAQQAVLAHLRDARDAAARQLSAVRRVPAVRDQAASAFIDARA